MSQFLHQDDNNNDNDDAKAIAIHQVFSESSQTNKTIMTSEAANSCIFKHPFIFTKLNVTF